jgi:two-component system phosphate regulon sensor histidine kinase PhoR
MAGQAERMQTLVSDLLTLSRLEGSPMPGFNEWVDLSGLMRQCEGEALGLAAALAPRGESGHELHFDEAPPLQLAGSAAELRSALSNLIVNALRHTPPSGRVEVGWRSAADGRLEFFVTDTGPGIAPEHIPRLTERFYRVDQSRSRESGGTGLGLAIVKHVIQRHGGELRIASTPGKGSCFSLLFPINRVREVPGPA